MAHVAPFYVMDSFMCSTKIVVPADSYGFFTDIMKQGSVGLSYI